MEDLYERYIKFTMIILLQIMPALSLMLQLKVSLNFSEKSLNLLKEWDGGERLRIFKADLQEDGSFDAAVRGCSGLFHVAASMQFEVPVEENVGNVLCIILMT